jgi:hypothetical protein
MEVAGPRSKDKPTKSSSGPVRTFETVMPNGVRTRVIVAGPEGLDIGAMAFLPMMLERAMADMAAQLKKVAFSSRPSDTIFYHPNMRKDLLDIGFNMARYLNKNKVGSLICVDRAARAGYLPVINAWRQLYPDQKRPEVYFINPEGPKHLNPYFVKSSFSRNHKYLIQRSNLPVAILDTCMHKGNSMRAIVKSLKEVGFKDIHFCIPDFDDSDSPVMIEKAGAKPFSILQRRPEAPCYPFAPYDAVEKPMSVVSSKKIGAEEEAKLLRREITQIFKPQSPSPLKAQ